MKVGYAETPAVIRIALEGSDEDFRLSRRSWNRQALGQRNALGQSVLHFTILRPERLAALLAAGADPNEPDQNETTPLMYAATYGNLGAVRLLVAHGADVWRRDRLNNRNVLDYALKRQSWEVVELLARVLQPSQEQGPYSRHVLNYTIMKILYSDNHNRWDTSILQKALRRGADPNLVVCCNSSLMHLIVNAEEGLCLLGAGFSRFDQQDDRGVTPVMRAASLPSSSLLGKLLEKDMNVNRKDVQGRTILHHMVNSLLTISSSDGDEYALSLRYNLLSNLSRLFNIGDDTQHLVRDTTHCSCSDAGHTPLASLIRNVFGKYWMSSAYIWLLDWYTLLRTNQHHSNIQAALLDIVWFRSFKESGYDHTCRHLSVRDLYHECQDTRRPQSYRVADTDGFVLSKTLMERATISEQIETWRQCRGPDDELEWVTQISKLLKAYGFGFEKPERKSKNVDDEVRHPNHILNSMTVILIINSLQDRFFNSMSIRKRTALRRILVLLLLMTTGMFYQNLIPGSNIAKGEI